MTLMSDGIAWLAGQLRSAAGQDVSLRRGSSTTDDITAVADSVSYEVVDAEGIVTRVRYRDWFIAKTDYVISSRETTPTSGDRIIDEEGTQWEVSPVGDRDAYTDHDGITWLLHTKRVRV